MKYLRPRHRHLPPASTPPAGHRAGCRPAQPPSPVPIGLRTARSHSRCRRTAHPPHPAAAPTAGNVRSHMCPKGSRQVRRAWVARHDYQSPALATSPAGQINISPTRAGRDRGGPEGFSAAPDWRGSGGRQESRMVDCGLRNGDGCALASLPAAAIRWRVGRRNVEWMLHFQQKVVKSHYRRTSAVTKRGCRP